MTKPSRNFCCLFLNLKFLCQLGFYVIFILLANSASGASPRNALERVPVIVDLKDQGLVVGNYDTTAWSAQRFMQFRGVPYAASPTGALRFKAPVARPKWNEPVDATNWGRRCPVITTISTLNEAEKAEDLEDCLNLCVYTKNLSGRAPVMMYIHGGGFYNGTSLDHPPKYLMEEDIVLVVPQYRVGALGFASSLTDEIPGNAGIADMLFALQWIQDHISTFGGDPTRVTIFGQSAGAAIVSALLVSPQIQDTSYFQNVIMQSGSILAQWAATADPVEQAKRICKNLNCQNCENLQDTNACLMKADVSSLLEVTKSESIAPVIGDKLGMLPNSPAALFKNYNKSINAMIGYTKHDGSYALGVQYDAIFNVFGDAIKYLSVRQFITETFNLLKDPTRLTNNLNTRLFFNRELLDGNNHTKALPSYFDLFNVLFFKSPAMATTTELLQHSKNDAKVFLYSFDYEGQNTRFGYEMGNERYPFNGGVHHSDDNIYLFSTHALNEKDAKISQKMVQLWTSFARDGVPKAEGNVAIEPMKSESGPMFHINEQIKLGYDAFADFTATMDDPNNYKLIRNRLTFL